MKYVSTRTVWRAFVQDTLFCCDQLQAIQIKKNKKNQTCTYATNNNVRWGKKKQKLFCPNKA